MGPVGHSPLIKWALYGLVGVIVVFMIGKGIYLGVKGAGSHGGQRGVPPPEAYNRPPAQATSPSPVASVAVSAAPKTVASAAPVAAKTESSPVAKTEQAKPAPKSTNCFDLNAAIDTIERSIPSWAQLDCHLASVSRFAIPKFSTRAITYFDAYMDVRSGLAKTYIGLWAGFPGQYGTNVGSTTSAGFPPYSQGQLSNDELDQKIRASMVAYLIEKKNGRPVVYHIDYPPNFAPKFNSADDFHSWLNNTYLPQKEAEAKVAEKLKAEYYVPFPTEADHFLGKFFQPGLVSLGEDARVALAQELIDKTKEKVRPLYTGRLTVQIGNNYDSEGEYWNKLKFNGWDEVGYTLIPTCDVPTAKAYFEKQLKNYVAMAQAANIAWSIQELSLYPKYFKACDKDMSAIENDIYKELYAQLNAQSYAPDGLWIEMTNPGADAKQSIIDFFKSKSS